jgi:hypothetical protein
LVVDTRFGKICFDGIEITDLKPGTHPFNFVAILASGAPGIVTHDDLTAKLSSYRQDGTQTARTAKGDAVKAIRSALKVRGLAFEDPFRPENGSYRLTVPAYVR